jgi:hypothetical protein
MDFENQLVGSAMTWGADYFGVADLTSARETIFEQGGTTICGLCLYTCPYGRKT